MNSTISSSSARRLGVELDETDALQWLTAMASSSQGSEIVVDMQSGIFGHRISLLDFSPDELAHFRRIGDIVGFADQPGLVETALALSGSAAQSKIQSYPGDADYFERVNIIAPTHDEACQLLAGVMRDKALEAWKGADYQLIEVKFGNYPASGLRPGGQCRQVRPLPGNPKRSRPVSSFLRLLRVSRWKSPGMASGDTPAWCKLDWVVVDPVRKRLVNASNMLDVTWEAPDGSITPLDGYLDPYFQEVYLEADSIPIFTKLAKHVSADALENYVQALEQRSRST